jgi:peptide/nickel transport system substrate-binding protein
MLIDNQRADLAEILVVSMKRIGVEVRPREVTIGPQLFGSKANGSYEIAVLPFPGPGPGGPNADPDALRILFTPTNGVQGNLQGATAYYNKAFNTLAEQQRVAFDQTERKAIVAQMQAILAQDLPVVPLYYQQTDAPYRKQVLGDQWYFTPGNFPSWQNNKQLMVTGMKSGTTIRTN